MGRFPKSVPTLSGACCAGPYRPIGNSGSTAEFRVERLTCPSTPDMVLPPYSSMFQNSNFLNSLLAQCQIRYWWSKGNKCLTDLCFFFHWFTVRMLWNKCVLGRRALNNILPPAVLVYRKPIYCFKLFCFLLFLLSSYDLVLRCVLLENISHSK